MCLGGSQAPCSCFQLLCSPEPALLPREEGFVPEMPGGLVCLKGEGGDYGVQQGQVEERLWPPERGQDDPDDPVQLYHQPHLPVGDVRAQSHRGVCAGQQLVPDQETLPAWSVVIGIIHLSCQQGWLQLQVPCCKDMHPCHIPWRNKRGRETGVQEELSFPVCRGMSALDLPASALGSREALMVCSAVLQRD